MAATPAPPPSPPSTVDFWHAFRFWLKLGFISFGGPAGQIAVMHDALVERKRWISEGRFLHALNYCMLLPGPEAQQLATYIGWLMHRTLGGIVAGVLFILPSLLILIALSWVYASQGKSPVIAGIFYGIKPVVAAIVIHAAHRIGGKALKNGMLVSIAVLAFIALAVFAIPFPVILLGAAALGFLGGKYRPRQFSSARETIRTPTSHAPALIDDDSPPPLHARPNRRRLVKIALAGGLLWLAPMGLLALIGGGQHLLVQMGIFFTQAALMTFGGAYAVLPYVVQGAVEHHGWLTPGQMMDGLALGETTPGPLIMVVAFVGYIGGHFHSFLGADTAFLSGALSACVVTWFTFLPSFLFILMGGPFVEATHGDIGFAAPLTAITAAVVGVILNLALYFGSHVLWPHGWEAGLSTGFDSIAAALMALAAWALLRWRWNVLWVVTLGALLGIPLRALGSP